MKRVLALVILITPYFSSFAQATQSRLTAIATRDRVKCMRLITAILFKEVKELFTITSRYFNISY